MNDRELSRPKRLSKSLWSVALVLSLLGLTSCYQYRVHVRELDPVSDYRSDTVHAWAWGLFVDPSVADDCLDNCIHEVRVSTNFAFAFVTVATLGFYAPICLEWRCGAAPDGNGEGPAL